MFNLPSHQIVFRVIYGFRTLGLCYETFEPEFRLELFCIAFTCLHVCSDLFVIVHKYNPIKNLSDFYSSALIASHREYPGAETKESYNMRPP
ncbi:hypothetical protein PUN28_015316 [Cardiocondyla obscurior]|uniref:Uncharacterized protein n=1 Tax=Cardiocondyla obscurior TaxID=286306 RepID=A0AAW2EVQ7_9HYME